MGVTRKFLQVAIEVLEGGAQVVLAVLQYANSESDILSIAESFRVGKVCRRPLELAVIGPGHATLDVQGLVVGGLSYLPVEPLNLRVGSCMAQGSGTADTQHQAGQATSIA